MTKRDFYNLTEGDAVELYGMRYRVVRIRGDHSPVISRSRILTPTDPRHIVVVENLMVITEKDFPDWKKPRGFGNENRLARGVKYEG